MLSATFASAQPADVVRGQLTVRGTVEAVDATARTVTIRGSGGNVVTIDVSKSQAGFDQLQVGDVVSVSYYDRVSVRPKPEGEPAVDRTDPPMKTPTPDAVAGSTVASQRVTTVTITGWDPATRVVTFTGPGGTSYTRRLLDTTDASIMTGLKVGDRVDVTRTEAVRLAVESRTTVAVDATSDFRHRFTISALWGWDNQFSGNMIQESTGQTTTGLPINLNETTYDDVYGRMGFFKIGAGYRTSPRSEAVLNFVLSRSSAELANVGTVNNTQVNVAFDDYNYWGFEGGQRFFFTRVRITPFLGYLVGINRYDDIRGEFVDPPAGVTLPGYAAADHKFFEKSWAFSLGPTGGLLIGLGPFEIMAEAQLRYMGGLSDVDWLVEEGLRDINSESSRWSYPIQLGARIRF
jgi:hypothetical protein